MINKHTSNLSVASGGSLKIIGGGVTLPHNITPTSTCVTHLSHHQDSTIQTILNSNRRNDDEGKLTYTSANEKEEEEEDACMQLSKRKTEH